MRSLPLYKDHLGPVERTRPLDRNTTCKRCRLHTAATSVCMPAAGTPGGALFVGDFPGDYEDAVNEPFTGRPGRFLKNATAKCYDGPTAHTYAVRCMPPGNPKKRLSIDPDKVKEKQIEACRGYLKKTIEVVKPDRIILLGNKAALAFFNESVQAINVRRGYGWYVDRDEDGEDLYIPVFIVIPPRMALNNTFHRKWFLKDLKWALNVDPEKLQLPPHDGQCFEVETLEDALEMEADVMEAGGFTYDIETAGRHHDKFFKVLCYALVPYGRPDLPYVINDEVLYKPEIVEVLKRIHENQYIKVCGQYVKFDHEGMQFAFDITTRGSDIDIRLVRKATWSDVSGKLDVMAYLVGMGGHKMEAKKAVAIAKAAINKERKRSVKAIGMLPGLSDGDDIMTEACNKPLLEADAFAYGLIDRDLLLRYNALDVVSTEHLRVYCTRAMEHVPSVNRIYRSVIQKTIEAVSQVEYWGAPVDRDAVMAYQRYLNAKIGLVMKKIEPYGIDPNKNKQIADLLFNQLDLPSVSSTDTGEPSTEKGALKAIEGEHPVVSAILEWRGLDKLRGTYAEGLVKYIRDDNRIHFNLDVAGASSGRTSMKDPNLQNIPRTSDEAAAMARNCFVAAPGRKLLQLDYSQLEYRVAAMLSGDPVMTGMFQRGEDFHTATAKLIAQSYFGVHPDDITKEMRSQAKTFNFGLLFGMTDNGMAQRMGCSKQKAAELRRAIMGEWVELDRWITEKLIESRESGFAYTVWDGEPARRRPLPALGNTGQDDKSSGTKRTAENSTNNTPVQGSASELCVASLAECVDWLRYDDVDAKLILSVHDSLIFDVADDDVEETAYTARNIMTQWGLGDVPLVVDAELGQSWGELKTYEIAA